MPSSISIAQVTVKRRSSPAKKRLHAARRVPLSRADLQHLFRKSARRFALSAGTSTVFFFMIAMGIGIGTYYAQAASGQIMKLITSDGGTTFYVGRCFRTDISVQTDNLNANSVDVILPYNPTYVAPYTNSGCTVAATGIVTDGLFPSYPSNTISSNTIQVTGYDPSGSSPVNTGANPLDRKIGHIYWKVLAASGAYSFNFDFTLGSTIDTNMAQNNGDGSDVLDAVQNLTVNLANDLTGPTFSSLSPASAATNVSVTSGISYVVSDAGAGVNSGSFLATLNAVSKTVSRSGCTTTNSNRTGSCNASISPGTLSYATTYTVIATADDRAASPNTGSQTWSFTTEDDTNAPYVQNQTPAANANNIATTTSIVLHIKDYKSDAGVTPGLGVDNSTIRVSVMQGTGATTVYQQGDPGVSITGTSADRTVTITPATPFAQNARVRVTVEASDLHSPANVMTPVVYYFRIIDSIPPAISDRSPAPNAVGVSADSNIVLRLSDSGAGIDINNTTVTINATPYTVGNGAFSYSGNTGSYLITINPASNFSGGQDVSVTVATRDLAPTPNSKSFSYSFAIASACGTCSVANESPARSDTAAPLSATLSFHVKDTGAGILSNSIRVTLIGSGPAMPVSPLTITGSSPMMAITGTSADYTVTITLPASIEENVAYALLIDATDTNGLSMSQVGYTFMHLALGTGTGTTTIINTVVTSCPAPAQDSPTVPSGGGRRPVQPLIESFTPTDLPTIIERRKLPDGKFTETTLTPEQARGINSCYIDAPLHGAALTPYSDVPAGAWYEGAVKYFIDKNILDTSRGTFNGMDAALRSEFAKVITLISAVKPVESSRPSFDDVSPQAWYYNFAETAGANGWMKGYNNCYGTHPCTLMPAATASRAEAIAMIVRYMKLKPLHLAPAFADVRPDAWYASYMQTAADYCILQGDSQTHRAGPNRVVNRAEMVTLFTRAAAHLTYGVDCGANNVHSSSASGQFSSASKSPITLNIMNAFTSLFSRE